MPWHFSPWSPALHCSIHARDLFSSWVQKELSHTQLGFSEPFSSIQRQGMAIVFLCNADHISFPLFFHISLPSLSSSLLLYLRGSPDCVFFSPQCLGRISLVFDLKISLPYSVTDSFSSSDCPFQSAPICQWFFDLDMSHRSFQLWVSFALHMDLQCIHFFSFSRLFVTMGHFFSVCCFQNTFILFSSSQELLFFVTSKHNFAVFVLDLDALPTLTNSTEKRNKLVSLYSLPLCKEWILIGGIIVLLIWWHHAKWLQICHRTVDTYISMLTVPLSHLSAGKKYEHNLLIACDSPSSENHKCIVLYCSLL